MNWVIGLFDKADFFTTQQALRGDMKHANKRVADGDKMSIFTDRITIIPDNNPNNVDWLSAESTHKQHGVTLTAQGQWFTITSLGSVTILFYQTKKVILLWYSSIYGLPLAYKKYDSSLCEEYE